MVPVTSEWLKSTSGQSNMPDSAQNWKWLNRGDTAALNDKDVSNRSDILPIPTLIFAGGECK